MYHERELSIPVLSTKRKGGGGGILFVFFHVQPNHLRNSSSLFSSGSFGIIWFTFWFFLAHETPAHHPNISDEERVYIQTAIGANAAKKVRFKASSLPPRYHLVVVCQ